MLHNYHPINAPLPGTWKFYSLREAQEFFAWFLENRTVRLQELRQALDANGGKEIPLDFNKASLAALGAWFNSHVEVCSLTPEEVRQQKQSLPERLQPYAHDFIATQITSEETTSLCYDMGIYFGEMMRHYHPHLQWRLWTRQDAHMHQAVLVPFPHNLALPSASILHSVAYRVIDGEDAAEELPQVFEVWEEYLPT